MACPRIKQALYISPGCLQRLHACCQTISRVLRVSGGVPRRIHFVAHEVLYDMPADVQEQWRDEDWIGEPIEEIELTDATRKPSA